jgi:hypothetical protein
LLIGFPLQFGDHAGYQLLGLDDRAGGGALELACAE